MARLTDKAIRALKPRDGSYYVKDDTGRRGEGRLCVKVDPNGSKTFYFHYFFDGKRKFFPIDKFPAISLADANLKKEEYSGMLRDGYDIREYLLRQQAKVELKKLEEVQAAREEELKGSVSQLFEDYTSQMDRDGKRTHAAVLAALRKDAIPVLGEDLKAKDVKAHHIKLVLSKLIKRGAVVYSNRIRSYLSAAFNYGIKHDNDPANLERETLYFIEHNPVLAVPRQNVEKARERDLSADELKRFWCDLPKAWFSKEVEIAVKLCFATGGQRPNEVLEAEWNEIDMDRAVWELPSTKTKNKRAHVVPLNHLAIFLLEELAPITGHTKYLFPNQLRNNEPMTSRTMSKAIQRYCEGEHIQDKEKRKQWSFERFVPRDIRRTCKTRMGEIGLSKEIRDRIANHALSDVSAKHYDRYDYLREKKQALDAWGSWLELTIEPDEKVSYFKQA